MKATPPDEPRRVRARVPVCSDANGDQPVRVIFGLFENATVGALFLLQCGSFHTVNELARAILRQGDGLYDNDGSLRARLPVDNETLQNMVASVLHSRDRETAGGAVPIRRPSRLPLLVQVHPMDGNRTESGALRFAALVLVRDPEIRLPIEPDHVTTILGLSPAEGQIVSWLAHGKTVREIVRQTGRSENTVRWTLKNVFAKTGCSSQMELVRAIDRLIGDILPPSREGGGFPAHGAPTAESAPRE